MMENIVGDNHGELMHRGARTCSGVDGPVGFETEPLLVSFALRLSSEVEDSLSDPSPSGV